MISFENLLKVIDSIANYAWAVFVVTLFVLFVPDGLSKQLDIDFIRDQYRGYWWIVCVFTGVLTLKRLISYLFKVMNSVLEKKEISRRQETKKAERLNIIRLRLNSLDTQEQMWIKCCLWRNVQTLVAQLDDATANSLVSKGILSRGSGSPLKLPFHIKDDVWKYILENKNFFLTNEECTDPEFIQMLENFPDSLHF